MRRFVLLPYKVIALSLASGVHFVPSGEVTERPKVQHWKCCVLQKGTVGSNPTLSANHRPSADSLRFFYGDKDRSPRSGSW
ncbi:conserved protein of unknown function [Acidithiobacillus ferrivorans]|uniref:Uncharacterized protein n=1 Tax=Acidithiobacillus ferrivorans TaxID=160808 RepID=A0A060UP94_9PROT|nr:conserved hypothetical protein [Acidithiobacillus ferrivorans]SMH64048.1 conserved protein of unknown function [Acidithiobacillus ferrivorans]